MTWFARGFAAVAATLAVVALVAGQALVASSMLLTMAGVLVGSTDVRRREAERQAAFAQRVRAARREPQAVVVVRRAPARFPARLVPLWVDVDGEARGRLGAGDEASFPVSAGERTIVARRPWSAGRPAAVAVPADGCATVEA